MQAHYVTRTLKLDAASCALFFAIGVGATAQVAPLLGLPAMIVAAAGWICLPSAALFAFLAFRPSRALLTLCVIGNTGWVLASAIVWLAYFGQLTTLGHFVVIAQALAVELFTVLEWRGLKAFAGSPARA